MRGESKLNRTLGESPTHWRVRQQPRKKNTPCISDLAGVKFLLKKERVFFFRGSAFQVFRQCGASIRTRFCENYFLGIWIFAKARLICFLHLSARRRGLGRNPRGLFGFFDEDLHYFSPYDKLVLHMNIQPKRSSANNVFFFSFLQSRELLFAL